MSRSAPPTVENKQSVRNPIDAFLLAKLEPQKLTFSTPADKEALLRRVTFDLTGLPPTIAEIDAFLRDSSPQAYEKVVDGLLASPNYGPKAALYWLDLVRYAESDGFKADDPRPNAWRYRDYVIDSFNRDKPFDRFIKEQIAGDELFPDDNDALVATAFLRHYPHEYNAINVEQRRQEILNDITDATAQTFLAVTLNCARCHNHKFDPITQKDYYRIQAFFAGWKPIDVPLLSKDQREAYEKQRTEWEEKTADIRQRMASVAEGYRKKEIASRRFRFPEEYSRLLDVPAEQRTPLQQQIAYMVGLQVTTEGKDVVAKMKPADKTKWQDLQKELAERAAKPPVPPQVMAMADLAVAPPTRMLKAGNWRLPGAEVQPGFLSAIDDRDATIKSTATSIGRRSALAAWLTDAENPLTARAMVNRLWQQHFGQGIVSTSGDFGAQGDKPTHRELLDWLARKFIASGWSVKQMHRLMVTSTAYCQSNRSNEAAAAVDPENHLLWRMNRRRLEGETIRDAILSIGGLLNSKMGGPSIYPELPEEIKASAGKWPVSITATDRNRRSIYVAVKRNLRYPLFHTFDATDRNETCTRRFVTNTAPQALMLLNEKMVVEHAKSFAKKVLDAAGEQPDAVIERAYRLAFGRMPNSEERVTMRRFLEKQTAILTQEKQPDAFKAAVADMCHAIINVNEFLWIE